MQTLDKSVFALAVCLSALAGCVDAIGFMELKGYFISFMSGNSTRLAVHMAAGDLSGVALLGGILLLFVMGSMLGILVRHISWKFTAVVNVLGFVTLLLACAAFSHQLGFGLLAVACMTLAMGAENAVFQRDKDVVIGLTYMTGTLVKVGQRLAYAILGGEKFAWARYLILWMGLIMGGIAGALSFHYFGLNSLWIAVVWAAVLTLQACLLKGNQMLS